MSNVGTDSSLVYVTSDSDELDDIKDLLNENEVPFEIRFGDKHLNPSGGVDPSGIRSTSSVSDVLIFVPNNKTERAKSIIKQCLTSRAELADAEDKEDDEPVNNLVIALLIALFLAGAWFTIRSLYLRHTVLVVPVSDFLKSSSNH